MQASLIAARTCGVLHLRMRKSYIDDAPNHWRSFSPPRCTLLWPLCAVQAKTCQRDLHMYMWHKRIIIMTQLSR